MMRMTPRSLPGMVLEEKRNRSPGFSSSPWYLPKASWAEAARRSPWLPVTSSIRFSRGMSRACSGLTTVGKSASTPVSIAASIMRRMARPRSTIERPALCPASASVFTRATLEAKVVAQTSPSASRTSVSMAGPTVASERPGCIEKMLVESQIRARTPSLQTSPQSSGSKGSPTTGVASSLKSPEWITRPAPESMTSAALSGIECETGRKPTLKGPALTCLGQAEAVRTAFSGWLYSSILRRAIFAVKARA